MPKDPSLTSASEPIRQFSLNNPTSSVRRGVVASGPDFLLPLEANARFGPIRVDGEVGYHFGNQSLPQSWIRGMIVGHEFSDSTEAYAEIYDQQDANRFPAGRGVGEFATGQSKQRQTTLGLGGRQALNKKKNLILMLMGGTSFQTVSVNNSQPTWIAYVGLQVLLTPNTFGRQAEECPKDSLFWPKDSLACPKDRVFRGCPSLYSQVESQPGKIRNNLHVSGRGKR